MWVLDIPLSCHLSITPYTHLLLVLFIYVLIVCLGSKATSTIMANQQKLEPSAAEQIENSLSNEKSNDTSSRQQALYEEFASRDEKWKAAQTKQLLRKVDFRLLPPVLLMYTLNILDRSNLSQAREGSLEQDLGMTGTDFNLATAILFMGYLLMQLPSNMLIVHIRPSLYLSAAMTLWGVVSTCNAAAKNFTSLVVIRFFLGFVEAPFFPGLCL